MYDAVLATYTETPFELVDPPEPRTDADPFDAGPHGWFVVAGPPQHVWAELRRAFSEISDPASKDADVPTKARLRHAAIERWMRSQPSVDALIAALEKARLACARVETLREALTGDYAAERQLLRDVDDREGGTRPVVRLPYRFSRSACAPRRPAPRRGEHNAEVLGELLGFDGERVRALEKSGVLHADPALQANARRPPRHEQGE